MHSNTEAVRRYRERHPKRGAQHTRVTKQAHRALLSEIKLERGCADCSYRGAPEALDFDHLPGSDKRRNVGAMLGYSWEAILSEVDKCEVVCANCHRIRTHDRRGE